MKPKIQKMCFPGSLCGVFGLNDPDEFVIIKITIENGLPNVTMVDDYDGEVFPTKRLAKNDNFIGWAFRVSIPSIRETREYVFFTLNGMPACSIRHRELWRCKQKRTYKLCIVEHLEYSEVSRFMIRIYRAKTDLSIVKICVSNPVTLSWVAVTSWLYDGEILSIKLPSSSLNAKTLTISKREITELYNVSWDSVFTLRRRNDFKESVSLP